MIFSLCPSPIGEDMKTKNKVKQIAIDVNAWNILNQVKKELNKTGRSVSHSDVIRYLKESRSMTE